MIKINKSLIEVALGTLSERKRAWIFSILCGVAIPFLDAAVTGSIYLIFTEEKREAVVSFISIYQSALAFDLLSTSIAQQTFFLFVGLGLTFFSIFLRYQNQLIIGGLREFFAVSDSQRLISKFLSAPTITARATSRERITSSLLHDCGSRENYLRNLSELGAAAMGLTLYGIGALAVSWQVVCVVAVIYATPFLITRKIYALVEAISNKQILLREKVIEQVREISDSIDRARTDGLETHLEARTLKTVSRQKNQNLEMVKAKAKFATMFDGFGQAQLLLVVFITSALLGQPLEALVILLIVFGKLQGYFGKITGGLQSINVASTKVTRYLALMVTLETMTVHKIDRRNKPEPTGICEITADKISFGYDEEEPIIEDLSLTIRAGEKLLVRGASGIGKSTLLEIIGGLLAPDRGTLRFNDEEVTPEVFQRFRTQICFVTPNVYIFNRTVRYNLSPNYALDDEQLWSALAKVELKEVVLGHKKGLDMPVGPNGSELSTGQRQRLVLARAFIQKPTVLILDEFTANLDLVTETRIINVVNELIGPESITVMAAHKLPSGFSPTSVLDLEEKGVAPLDRRSDH